jgi:hypothetical protein
MHERTFSITKEGQVYHLQGCFWVRLGHIASILGDETSIGQEVRKWWWDRLVSDEPTENLAIEKYWKNLPAVPVSNTQFVPAWELRTESPEASIAAA